MKPYAILAALAIAAAAAGQTQSSQTHQPKSPAKPAHEASADRGQQVFNQNCSRCHQAPDGFPPSISQTVAMHMRVRANLSDADYKALLRFLNP
jgi:mono/diheme cytochrome c family protein